MVNLVNWVSIVIVAGFMGMWLHELSHWFAGIVVGSEPKIFVKFGLPYRVKHGNIQEVQDHHIRLFGAVPLFWWIPLAFTTGTLVSGLNGVKLFAFVTLLVTVATFSRADIRAMADPEQYRILTTRDELSNMNGYSYLVRRIF